MDDKEPGEVIRRDGVVGRDEDALFVEFSSPVKFSYFTLKWLNWRPYVTS